MRSVKVSPAEPHVGFLNALLLTSIQSHAASGQTAPMIYIQAVKVGHNYSQHRGKAETLLANNSHVMSGSLHVILPPSGSRVANCKIITGTTAPAATNMSQRHGSTGVRRTGGFRRP